jgi:hypothetical protein
MGANTPEALTAEAARELQAFVNKTERTDDQIRRRIESLEVSADVKALLSDLLRLATRVGDTVLRVGRKILDFVLTLARLFPTLTFAVVIASVLTMLVAMVPVVGGLLATIIGPLMYALGVAGAAALEVQAGDFRQRVAEFAAGFKTQAA